MIFTFLNLFTGDASRTEIAASLVLLAAVMFNMFVSLPVHESAHALAAYALGDDTGRLKGRITLNPFAHLTLPGTLMMLFLGFGYARPVPVNIFRFKNRKLGFALTALAGPVSNLLLSFLTGIIAALLAVYSPDTMAMSLLYLFFYYVSLYNIVLALFNLIPIPPLDGSRLLTLFLPDKYYYKLLQYERYFIYAIFILSFMANRISFIPSLTDIALSAENVFQSFLVGILR